MQTTKTFSQPTVNSADGGEAIDPKDMYCFRCIDTDNDGSTADVWVHVDILWDEFASKLARRFGRPVFFQYSREGDTAPTKVQCEDDFEELCEYLDDSQVLIRVVHWCLLLVAEASRVSPQIHTLQVDVKSARRRRMAGGTDDAKVGGRPSSPGDSQDPQFESRTYYAPDRNISVGRPRPGTAIESRKAAPHKRVYGSIVRPPQPSRTAWEANGTNQAHTEVRQRRTHRIAVGNLDKEEMQDRMTALQRQVCALIIR